MGGKLQLRFPYSRVEQSVIDEGTCIVPRIQHYAPIDSCF